MLHSKYIELDPTIASMISKNIGSKEDPDQVKENVDLEEELDR